MKINKKRPIFKKIGHWVIDMKETSTESFTLFQSQLDTSTSIHILPGIYKVCIDI